MKCLLRAAELIRRQKEELALIETLESGKPITQARDEMDWAAGLWDYAATLCRHIYGDSYNALGPSMLGLVIREPVGVVGMITPWNFPLLIISQKLPFALAAGCTCVIKPSELTSGTTLLLGKIVKAGDKGAWYADARNAVFVPVFRQRKSIQSALETRFAQVSFPDYSTVALFHSPSPAAPPWAPSAFRLSAITRDYRTG